MVAMKGGVDLQKYVDLLVPGPAKLKIIHGEGPINLVGSHCVDYFGFKDEDVDSEEEDEEDTISNMAPCVAKSLNNFTTELRRLFLVENMVDTIKFGLSLWLLTYLGSWFNFLTLLILAWLVLFTAPKLYINNQAQVDEVVGMVMAQVEDVKAKVVALIPNKAAVKEE